MEDTLIIYSSDNGSYRKDRVGALRGKKGENWEGGIRVPGIFIGQVPSQPVGLKPTRRIGRRPSHSLRPLENRSAGRSFWTGQISRRSSALKMALASRDTNRCFGTFKDLGPS